MNYQIIRQFKNKMIYKIKKQFYTTFKSRNERKSVTYGERKKQCSRESGTL